MMKSMAGAVNSMAGLIILLAVPVKVLCSEINSPQLHEFEDYSNTVLDKLIGAVKRYKFEGDNRDVTSSRNRGGNIRSAAGALPSGDFTTLLSQLMVHKRQKTLHDAGATIGSFVDRQRRTQDDSDVFACKFSSYAKQCHVADRGFSSMN